MLSNLLTVTGQVGTLFLMMGVGFALAKLGKLTEQARGQLSYLLLYIVCPCVMVDCFQVERTPDLVREVALGAALATVCYVVYLLIALFFFRRESPDVRDCLRFGTVYGNIGFMGIPLVQSILGADAVIYGALSLAAFNLTLWTLGVLVMGGKQAFSVKKAAVNPGVLGLAVSLLLFLGNVRLPAVLGSAVSFLSDLNTPLAMVVIGGQLACADLAATFRAGAAVSGLLSEAHPRPGSDAAGAAAAAAFAGPVLRAGASLRHPGGGHHQPLRPAVWPRPHSRRPVHYPVHTALHPHPASFRRSRENDQRILRPVFKQARLSRAPVFKGIQALCSARA